MENTSIYVSRENFCELNISTEKTHNNEKEQRILMRQHIDEVFKLISDIRIWGVEVSEIDSNVDILMSLPRGYEKVKSALKNHPSVNVTLEFVTQ